MQIKRVDVRVLSSSTRHFESLERRQLLCAAHLDPALVAELNALPLNSPRPFDFAPVNSVNEDESVSTDPPPAQSTTILNNGAPSNRIDIVLVGDGYTTNDMPTYTSHADTFVNSFFNEVPYTTYKPLFNVHRVDVISVDSGVDNDPSQGISKNTALGMSFWCAGIERLLCMDTSAAASYAANAPQADQVVGIANSTMYGGAGYSGNDMLTYSGGNGSAMEVARHEFGHSFADLADEYDYGGNSTYTGPELWEANSSIYNATQLTAQQRKWYRWIGTDGVGAFEGSSYNQFGVYRPTNNSKMRSLGRPWEPVNTEQTILNVYKVVNPIDSATAAGSYGFNTNFSVDPIDPVGHSLNVQWMLNGSPIPSATGLNFNPSTLNLSGNHTLGVTVVDNTSLVRDPAIRSTWMTESRTWQLLDNVAPAVTSTGFEIDAPKMTMTFSFSENVGTSLIANDLTLKNLTTNQTIPSGQLAVQFNTTTNQASVTFTGNPRGILPDGNYELRLAANSVSDAAGNSNASQSVNQFYFLQSDFDRNGEVGFSDLLLAAQNYGQTGHPFSAGNANYDQAGNVDFDDLLLTAQNYSATVPVMTLSAPRRQSIAKDVFASDAVLG